MLRTPLQDSPDPPPITEGPYEPPAGSPWFRWGMLFIIAGLFINTLSVARPDAESSLERHSLLALPLILLFNHFAFSFRWRRRWLSIAWQVLAYSWLVIGVFWLEWSARQREERMSRQKRASAVSVIWKAHA
jgi:hypothetical protein